MNDEIKETLEFIKDYIDRFSDSKLDCCFEYKDIKILLDYITNLQQEIENKNNEIDVLKDQVEWWKQQCDDLEMQIGESNG